MTRITYFLLLWIASTSLLAQDASITYNALDKELSQVFKDLEKIYGLRFSYSVTEVEDKKVSIEMKDESLEVFLDKLLTTHQLTFELVNDQFVSIKRASTLLLRMTVIDSETGEVLPFATARIKGTDQGYIAGVHGNFEVSLPDPDQTILEISFLGYEKKEVLAPQISDNQSLTIYLQREAKELQEIIIKEYLNKGITIDDRASRISIETQEMEILPGLSERDVLLSAQVLAGIGSADESAGGLNVRGSSRDNTMIYWNKIPVYQSAHYFGNISSFIPSAVGRVEIYKNYVPVSYGGSSSGLVLINSRNPTSENVLIESNLNLTHGDAYISVPFANYIGRISIGARRSFNDVFATPTFNAISNKLFEGSLTEDVQSIADDFEYNSKLVFNDLNVTMDFKPSSKNEFSFSLLHSQSKLNYDSQDDEDIVQSLQEHNVKTFGTNFNWTRRWREQVSSGFSTSYADYHMDYSLINIRNEDDGTEDDLQRRVNNLGNLESRLSLTYVPVKHHTVDVGYQFNRVKTDLTIRENFFFEEDFSESIKGQGNTHGIFLNYFGKHQSGIQLGMGLRHNYYESLKEHRLDRQVRLNYEAIPGFMLKSTAGVYHQFISSRKEVDFVFSNTIEQNWVAANKEEEIPVIKNEQLVLGALLTKAGWVIDLEGYVKRVRAPVARNFGPQPEEEDGLITGIENIKGIDLTIKKRWKYYRAWISYTFQDSEVEALSNRFVSGLNIRHQWQLAQTLSWRKFEFSIGYTIKSGLPYSKATTFERIESEDEESFFEIAYEEINGSRLPAYKRLDLSVWYKFKKRNASRFSGQVGFSVLNVLNNENGYSRTFSIEEDDNDQVFLQQSDRRLIGITPNLSIRLSF